MRSLSKIPTNNGPGATGSPPDLHNVTFSVLPGSGLQLSLERAIGKLQSSKIISADQRLGFLIVDLTSLQVLATYNSNQNFQSASMIKLFIALAAFEKQRSGKGSTQPMDNTVRTMLEKSDNDCANTIISDFGGPESLAGFLKNSFPWLESLRITEYIPENGASYNNSASPECYARLLIGLYRNEFTFSSDFLELISINQRSRFKGGRTARVVPEEALLWHKTGSTSRCCGEAAIVSPGPEIKSAGNYFICAIIDRTKPAFHYEGWIDSTSPVVGSFSAAAWEFQRKKYGLKKGSGDISSIEWLK